MPVDERGHFYYRWYPEKFGPLECFRPHEVGVFHRVAHAYILAGGHLTSDPQILARLIECPLDEFLDAWDVVQLMFGWSYQDGYLHHEQIDEMLACSHLQA